MNDAIFEDAFNLLCGPQIGEGIHRKVFLCKIDPDLVVKVEHDTAYWTGSNAAEWRNWEEFGYASKEFSKWLAPCARISASGRILLQKRTSQIPSHMLPKQLPVFFTDIKWENFGMYQGRVVAHDYPTIITTASKRLKKVNWNRDDF